MTSFDGLLASDQYRDRYTATRLSAIPKDTFRPSATFYALMTILTLGLISFLFHLHKRTLEPISGAVAILFVFLGYLIVDCCLTWHRIQRNNKKSVDAIPVLVHSYKISYQGTRQTTEYLQRYLICNTSDGSQKVYRITKQFYNRKIPEGCYGILFARDDVAVDFDIAP